MKSAIILLALAVTVLADGDIFVPREEALNQLLEQLTSKEDGLEIAKASNIAQEIRKIRATSTVLGWIDPNLNSCQSLTGNIGTYCGLNYKTPGVLVRRIAPILEVFAGNLGAGLTSSCQTTLKQVLCKGFFPRCSSDSSTATYESLTSECLAIGACGPAAVINVNGQTSLSICQDSGKTINLKSCSRYSSSTINGVQCGNLPANITFPSLSIADLTRQGILAGNLPIVLGAAQTSVACQNQWVQFLCNTVPYCSPDKSQILTAVTKQQCESAINCLPSSLKQSFSASYKCSSYPDQSGVRKCVDPSQGFKQTNTNLACNRASAISIGSTLFYLACLLLAYFH